MKVIGMASIPSRVDTLEIVIKRLHVQVDVIELALNGYKKIPPFLSKYSKVNPMLTDNTMGDANKYKNVEMYNNDYYFSCDDDILYPMDYVDIYIKYIDLYQCLITSHGSLIPPRKLASYYKGRVMKSHCLRDCKEERVHIPGSGVSGYHTSFLKLKHSHFEMPNMADIFLGIQCYHQNVECISIPHSEGWIQGGLNELLNRDTIWDSHRKNDKVQTKYINSINWSKK
jgi:hypothetical protein